MNRAEMIRGGGWYNPTQAQRVQLRLARLSFHRHIERLRIARAVQCSSNVVLLERAKDRADPRRFTGNPITGWGSF